MAVTVCTGWHPPAWEHYARRFVESFDKHWPAEVGFVAYTEEVRGLPCRPNHRLLSSRLLWDIPGARRFYDVHSKIPEHCGLKPTPFWRAKDIRQFESGGLPAWRWDAVRFFKQCVIPHAAAQGLPDGDVLVWLDADVVTFADVPGDLVEGLLAGADLCYLGRSKGSEIGFWAVRLNLRSRAFLADLSGIYLEDRIFRLPQFHSAYAFDRAREAAELKGLETRNLTPGGREHVWMQCTPLMMVSDHCKGPRKDLGHSPEHPLKWWQS